MSLLTLCPYSMLQCKRINKFNTCRQADTFQRIMLDRRNMKNTSRGLGARSSQVFSHRQLFFAHKTIQTRCFRVCYPDLSAFRQAAVRKKKLVRHTSISGRAANCWFSRQSCLPHSVRKQTYGCNKDKAVKIFKYVGQVVLSDHSGFILDSFFKDVIYSVDELARDSDNGLVGVHSALAVIGEGLSKCRIQCNGAPR